MEVERRGKIRLVGKINFQDLMRCALNLTALDVAVYFELLNGEVTVKKLSDKLSRNRSTIQRALTNLISKGLAIREPKTMKNGGYYFEYRAIPLKQVKETIREKVREWYTKMSIFLKEKLLDYKSSE
ncbi:MAG: helix-turn-helix domain-containing protein [Candidatus Baldrarchaeia archaeon]